MISTVQLTSLLVRQAGEAGGAGGAGEAGGVEDKACPNNIAL